MSTATLVMLAILVAATAMGALSFIRWRDKKRLEQARSIVTHSDFIMALNTIGSGLEPWLSASMLSFVGRSIQYHHQLLKEFDAPASKRVNLAAHNAMQWAQTSEKKNAKLPSTSEQAQEARNNVRSLLAYLRDAYKSKQLSAVEAKRLLEEAKDLNLKITLSVLQEKYTTAARLHNHFQALHYLNRINEFLNQLPKLTAEQKKILSHTKEKIAFHENERNEASTGSRLEEGASALKSEDESWKKKRYDFDS